MQSQWTSSQDLRRRCLKVSDPLEGVAVLQCWLHLRQISECTSLPARTQEDGPIFCTQDLRQRIYLLPDGRWPAGRDTDLTDDGKSKAIGLTPPTFVPMTSFKSNNSGTYLTLISITRVNPDKDVQPTSQFKVYNASELPSAIHSPQGAFLGTMHTERTKTMLQADQNTPSSQSDDFPQAIAKLIVRYKDGCESGSHSVPYRNRTATLLLRASQLLSSTPWVQRLNLVALPLNFNPRMKHYFPLFTERAEFGARPDAFSFI